MPQRITLATRVTLVRLLGVPVFVLLMVYYTMALRRGEPADAWRLSALGLFLLVALTDALDGFLARSRNEVTELGKLLDPVADKALLVSSLVVLAFAPGVEGAANLPVWFVVLAISRDVMLAVGAALIRAHLGALRVHPRVVGKVATFLQMSAVVWVLAQWPLGPFQYLLWAAALCTLASGLAYLRDGVRQVEGHGA